MNNESDCDSRKKEGAKLGLHLLEIDLALSKLPTDSRENGDNLGAAVLRGD